MSYATVAVSSPLLSRSGRQLARSGSSAEDVLASRRGWSALTLGRDHQVARCLRVLRHVGTAWGAVGVAAGAELFKGGAGGVQKTVEILQVPIVVVPQIQFIDRVCPLRVNRDRYPQELQFLDKVVNELVLCNDRCSKGSCVSPRLLLKNFFRFPRDGELGSRVDSRFAWKSRFPRAPCIWQSLPQCSFVQSTKAFGRILCFCVKVVLSRGRFSRLGSHLEI